jgi:hypothetical protein
MRISLSAAWLSYQIIGFRPMTLRHRFSPGLPLSKLFRDDVHNYSCLKKSCLLYFPVLTYNNEKKSFIPMPYLDLAKEKSLAIRSRFNYSNIRQIRGNFAIHSSKFVSISLQSKKILVEFFILPVLRPKSYILRPIWLRIRPTYYIRLVTCRSILRHAGKITKVKGNLNINSFE